MRWLWRARPGREIDYTREATKIAQALLKETIVAYQGQTLLCRARPGFRKRIGRMARWSIPPTGSSRLFRFWAHSCLPIMAVSRQTGAALLQQMQFGAGQAPGRLGQRQAAPEAGDGFPPEFGYNSVRIPLYLVRGGIKDPALLTRLKQGMSGPDGLVTLIDLSSDKVVKTLSDPGYQIISDLVSCVVDGGKMPTTVKQFTPTLYYPSTLHLLGLAYAAEKHPECL